MGPRVSRFQTLFFPFFCPFVTVRQCCPTATIPRCEPLSLGGAMLHAVIKFREIPFFLSLAFCSLWLLSSNSFAGCSFARLLCRLCHCFTVAALPASTSFASSAVSCLSVGAAKGQLHLRLGQRLNALFFLFLHFSSFSVP
jgi:hypothetical protein